MLNQKFCMKFYVILLNHMDENGIILFSMQDQSQPVWLPETHWKVSLSNPTRKGSLIVVIDCPLQKL